MIKVIGNSPQKITIPDLQEVIYYKQVKIFSEDEYKGSKDLQKKIQQGLLTIVDESQEQRSTYIPPTSVRVITSSQERKNNDVEDLMSYVKSLESKLDNLQQASPPPESKSVDNDKLDLLLNKIYELEKKLGEKQPSSEATTQPAQPQDNSSIMQAISNLEKKINSNVEANALIQKLEKLVSSVGSGGGSNFQDTEPTRPEDIYVPNVTVEDGNSHINLKVRSVEKSDNINDALKALKKLKSKSK